MKAVKGTVRKYYKYESWTQPVFTSATTWGNVTADNWYDEPNFHEYPYMALDGKTTGTQANYAAANGVTSVNWYWQFAEPLSISKIKIWNRNQGDTYGGATTYTIYGLNADSTYTQIGTISVAAQAWATGETNISNSDMFYGLKIYCQGTKTNVGIGELLLTASTVISGTVSDYDFYKDVDVPKLVVDSFAKKANVLKVGNVLDNNGVISNFNSTRYAEVPSNFAPSTGTWDIVLKIHTPRTSGYRGILGILNPVINEYEYEYDNSMQLYLEYGHLNISIVTTSETITVLINPSISTNSDYWVKISFSGTAYTASYSSDGISYTDFLNQNSTANIVQDSSYIVALGMCNSYSSIIPFSSGTIDLNECYININGQRWWSGTVTTKKYYGINI